MAISARVVATRSLLYLSSFPSSSLLLSTCPFLANCTCNAPAERLPKFAQFFSHCILQLVVGGQGAGGRVAMTRCAFITCRLCPCRTYATCHASRSLPHYSSQRRKEMVKSSMTHFDGFWLLTLLLFVWRLLLLPLLLLSLLYLY